MMRSFNLSLALVCIITASNMINPALSQNTYSTPQDFLDAHNAARANLTVSVSLPALVWSSTLEAYAQTYANAVRNANGCSSTAPSGNPPPYGENIFVAAAFLTGIGAVGKWVDQKQYYTYSTNTCAAGKVCKHYTQVVWRNSLSLGCARVQCYNNGWYYVVCSYDPPGNVVGQSPY